MEWKLTLLLLFDETLEEEQLGRIALRKAALAMLDLVQNPILLLAILGIFYLDEPLKDLSLKLSWLSHRP